MWFRTKHRVLLYHRVVDDDTPRFMLEALSGELVTKSNFSAQLEWLRRKFEIVDLQTIIANKNSKNAMAAITFDDGFYDNLSNAAPILDSMDLPSAVFIISGALGGDGSRRHHLARLLSISPPSGKPREVLRQFENDGEYANRQNVSCDRYLTSSEVAVLPDYRMSVHSHGVSHTRATELSITEFRTELKDSKSVLEQLVSRPVDYFAYPIGRVCDFTTDNTTAVRDAGFSAAFTSIRGELQPAETFELPRFGTRNDVKRTKKRLG